MKWKLSSLHAERKKPYLSVLLFCLSALLSVITTYYVSAHYIDSDTSSELVLTRHLLDLGTLLSQDWFYATELRFLHVQWIYAPLMLLLEDWQMVRFVGALIMQALYLASFACLVRAAGKSKQFFFYGASLLLLPVSVTYGRIVLYHNHYLLNISISFLLLALTMHFSGEVNWRSKKTWLYLVLLAALSFVGGVNSIRQLMITHAPMVVLAFVLCWIEDANSKDSSSAACLRPSNLNLLLCSVYSAAFSLLGLLAQGFLQSKLGLHLAVHAESNVLSFVGFNYIPRILYAFFHQFGYREKSIQLLSASGILSLGGIFTGCFLILTSAKRLLKNRPHHDRRTCLLSSFFLAYTSVMMIIF